MLFEWNETKRQRNLLKHGFDFADCARVFAGTVVTTLDDRFDYRELRLTAFGFLGNRVVAISFTPIDEVIRIISMREATRHEQAFFFSHFKD